MGAGRKTSTYDVDTSAATVASFEDAKRNLGETGKLGGVIFGALFLQYDVILVWRPSVFARQSACTVHAICMQPQNWNEPVCSAGCSRDTISEANRSTNCLVTARLPSHPTPLSPVTAVLPCFLFSRSYRLGYFNHHLASAACDRLSTSKPYVCLDCRRMPAGFNLWLAEVTL